jgi:16S rRNA (cytidine1402-2'-O)-methyltransferase
MSLELIATPIGHSGDMTLRAIEVLRSADVVIGEERREVSKLLKHLGIEGKRLELLNEHTRDADLNELVSLCRTSRVALVSSHFAEKRDCPQNRFQAHLHSCASSP